MFQEYADAGKWRQTRCVVTYADAPTRAEVTAIGLKAGISSHLEERSKQQAAQSDDGQAPYDEPSDLTLCTTSQTFQPPLPKSLPGCGPSMGSAL